MTVEIVDPATGQVTYRHELMGAADIEQRLQAAADAFPAGQIARCRIAAPSFARSPRSCARVATTCSRR
jgi:acyl-CoA reductase-like NAD-dependent aldehyde dehydrogenase